MVSPTFSVLAIVVAVLAIDSMVAFHLNLKQFISQSEYIIGGELARTGQFPYQVQLVDLDRERGFCGGSIISDRWIVTAAHCTQDQYSNSSRIGVLVGATNVNSTGRIVRLSQIFNHPEYRGFELLLQFDISLLQTKLPLEFSDTVRTIPLNRRHIGGGVRAVISGWGMTEDRVPSADLRYVYMYILENEQCRENSAPPLIHNSTICAFRGIGYGTCAGDSGSPLIAGGGLVGIASWVILPCGGGRPDAYTRVSSFVDWIEEVTGIGNLDI